MIVQLDKEVELYICHSWYNSGSNITKEHGICGHTFEMIEYYWKLKDSISCKLLWTESLTWDVIEEAIRSKYNFNKNELKEIKDNSEFYNQPKLITGKNILIVDGGFTRLRNSTLLFKKIIVFACGEKDNNLITDPKITILQDQTKTSNGYIYEPGERTIHYKKKLLLDKYKELSLNNIGYFGIKTLPKTTLLYLTGNCREMKLDDVRKCIIDMNKKYGSSTERNWLIATNDVKRYLPLEKEFKLSVQELPIKNFHDQFDNYVYTGIDRKWDCSNRLLVECKHYNKTFQSWGLDENYYKHDKALLGRKFDLSDINKKLNLLNDNEIINIIKGII